MIEYDGEERERKRDREREREREREKGCNWLCIDQIEIIKFA